jgi:predicted membrane-bound dolichyl-phosphate-mannose-protein mannosyltransferase
LITAPWTAHADMHVFLAWGERLATGGAANFYENWCDYLPGYLYVLWPIGLLSPNLPLPLSVLLGKLPSLLADIATAYIIWRMTASGPGNRQLWIPAIYLFNPAIILNSTIWGQVDSFHTLCIVAGAALLIRRRPEWAALCFGYAAAVKPHGIIILPLAGLCAVVARIAWYRVLLAAGLVVVAFLATCLPFVGWSVGDVPGMVQDRIQTTMDQYHFASINALNLWYLLGKNWRPDETTILGPVTIRQTGTLLFSVCYVLALGWCWHRRREVARAALWEAASIIYLALFLFITRAHERHLFPYLAMAAIAAGWHRAGFLPYTILSLNYCANLGLAWHYLLDPSTELCRPWIAYSICAVNLLMLPLVFIAYSRLGPKVIDGARRVWSRLSRTRPIYYPVPASPWFVRRWKLILTAIIVFAFGVRVIRLNSPPKRYFDEVYHAYTAEQWVKGNHDAWLWSTKAPDKGCSYEWTHPPLAKLAMATSMRLFGVHPWAWRLPAALFGTLSILLIFLIGRAIFANVAIGLLAAALAALDTLPLVMSRIGMNDIYCVTLILTAVLAGLRSRYVLAAIAIGLALACKWTALYALPLLGLIHILWVDPQKRWRSGRLMAIASTYFIAVPAIYLGSYLPFFLTGHSIEQFKDLQKQMWWYHTRLDATHPYSSPAWQWPFAISHVWCHTEKSDGQRADEGARTSGTSAGARPGARPNRQAANIVAVGNPVILLTGVGAMLLTLVLVVRRRDPRLVLTLAGYLVFWAPWLLSPRIMFIYHYLPSLPFLYLALAAAVVGARVKAFGVMWLLALAAIIFALAYPFTTALLLPENLAPANWHKLIALR